MLGICCRILSIGQQPGESVEVEDRGKLPLNHNVNVNLVSGKITGRGWIEVGGEMRSWRMKRAVEDTGVTRGGKRWSFERGC